MSMSPTLYAAFDDVVRAEAAAAALLHRGIDAKEISLIAREPQKEGTARPDDRPVDEGLNPAQNDYPRGDSTSPTEFSSAVPNMPRMYNTGLETRDYDRKYDQQVEKEIEADVRRDRVRATDDMSGPEADAGLEAGKTRERPTTQPTPTAAVRIDEAGVERQSIPEPKNTVAASAGLGVGIGALAAATALAVPGAGLILGGGILASGVAALAASSKAGLNADNIVNFLKDHEVPAEEIPKLREAYANGGAILSVGLDKHTIPATEIEGIVREYAPSQVKAYGYAA